MVTSHRPCFSNTHCMSVKIECTNCSDSVELPENPSLDRLNVTAFEFFVKHRTKTFGTPCEKHNLFIRTFSL